MIYSILIAIALGAIGAISGALSGQGYPKIIRKLGVAGSLTLLAFFALHYNLWVAIVALIGGVLSLGYGIPDENDLKPSLLGKLAYQVINHPDKIIRQNRATILVRSILGLLEAVVLIVIPIIKFNWTTYIIIAPLLIVANAVFSLLYANKEEIKIFGQELLPSELAIYGSITFLGSLLILF
jgi:hypothetical protein